MQYRTLGRTGVPISTLALGAMNFGAIGRTSQEDVTAIIGSALDAGITLIDTADVYSGGQSEEMVGTALAGRRDDDVLATKASLPLGEERHRRGSSRRWLISALEAACDDSAWITSTSSRSTAGTRARAMRRPSPP